MCARPGIAASGPRYWGPRPGGACGPTTAACTAPGRAVTSGSKSWRTRPFPAHRPGGNRDPAGAERGGYPGRDRLGAEVARSLPPGRPDDAGRRSPPGRGGAGQSGRGAERARRRGPPLSARKGERWWGWGEGGGHEPGAEALALLREEIGPSEAWDPPESIGSIELPDPEPLPAGLGQLGKRLQPSVGVADRIRHAGGKGFVDLARMRLGELEHAPDAVFRPADAAAVAALLEACAAEDV